MALVAIPAEVGGRGHSGSASRIALEHAPDGATQAGDGGFLARTPAT